MTKTTELFITAKEQLDIKACAEYYGMKLDRNGKGVCPFHDDHHPSLSFKGKYFKCFSCDEGGDVFKLVGKLTGIEKPIDVLKLLNKDWGLNLPLDAKISKAQMQEIRQKSQENEHYKDLGERFEEWSKHAFIVCNTYSKLLREWREEYKPDNQDEELHPLFVESLQMYDYMEYIMEELIYADTEVMQEFYLTHSKEVDKYEQRIREYEAERTEEARVS